MTSAKARIISFVSTLPWLWIAGLLILAIRARIFLGFWPRPSHPDPKLLPFEIHHLVLWIGFHLILWMPLLGAAFASINLIFFKKRLCPRPLWAFMTGWILIVVMIFAPHVPFNWMAWFLD